jgi:hypothetical protein
VASERTPDAEDEDGSVHRLHDIQVEEISLVDRPANRRRFLLVKRSDDMQDGELYESDDGTFLSGLGETETEKAVTMPGPVKEAVASLLKQAIERLSALARQVEGAQSAEEKAQSPLPPEIARGLAAVRTLLGSLAEKYPSPAGKADDEDEDDKEKGKAKKSEPTLADLKAAIDALSASLQETAKARRGHRGGKDDEDEETAKAKHPAAHRGAKDDDEEDDDKGGKMKKAGAVDNLAEGPQLLGAVKQLAQAVAHQAAQLSEIRKAHGGSNALDLESRAGKETFSWPWDMNSLLDEKDSRPGR